MADTAAPEQEQEKPTSGGSVSALAKGNGGDASEAHADEATKWFLEADNEDFVTDEIKLNVGTKNKPSWIVWSVRSIHRDRIDQIRKQSRTERRGVIEANEMQANLRIAAEGTIAPDLRDPAIRGQYADPADALNARFRAKGGLIDQIAGKIIELSGYDDDDVKEVEAAGN